VTNRKSEKRKGKVQLVDARQSWVKMRKSLGAKRKEISPDQIADITRLYGEFTEGDRFKIFPNERFGYLRITVERPLRLRWEIDEETLSVLGQTTAWLKLSDEDRADLTQRLESLVSSETTQRDLLAKKIGKIPKPFEKALWDAVATRDSDAPVVVNRKGEPEPDPELRDNENVPLPKLRMAWSEDPTSRLQSVDNRTAIQDYMKAEVLPYVPDAWVDYDKTKIGYEIQLTRHFYRFVPPRPLAEIDTDIKTFEKEIQDLLGQVTE
jgi:type I restriction enzyme M protein